MVVVGEEAFFNTVQELWQRQQLSSLLWCKSSDELVGKVGPLCPLVIIYDTQNQDARALGSFAQPLRERHVNQRIVWLFVGEFGPRTRLLVPHGAGGVPLDRAATTIQEAIMAAI